LDLRFVVLHRADEEALAGGEEQLKRIAKLRDVRVAMKPMPRNRRLTEAKAHGAHANRRSTRAWDWARGGTHRSRISDRRHGTSKYLLNMIQQGDWASDDCSPKAAATKNTRFFALPLR
jgi:hypothetical protein